MKYVQPFWTQSLIEQVRGLVALKVKDADIGARLGFTGRQVEGMRRRFGIRSGSPHNGPPADFAERIPTMGVVEAARHYGVAHDTISRWKHATGTQSKPVVQRTKRQTRKTNSLPTGVMPVRKYVQTAVPSRDGGLASEAQLQLQKGGVRVFRASIVKPDAAADQWIVGSRTMSEDEMIRLASERYGMRWAA